MEINTWPQPNWSSWLNEPILPGSDGEVTQINLIERITVTRPTQSLEQTRESRQSIDYQDHGEKRRRRSSSERRSRARDRALSHEGHETSTRKSSSEEKRRRRSSSEDRIRDRVLDHHSEGYRPTINSISSTQSSSEERYRERRRRRSSSEDRSKEWMLANERHTTGKITSQSPLVERHKGRSLSRERRQHCRSELVHTDLSRDNSLKTTRHVGTSMHGQIFLQDGSLAPESKKINPSKEDQEPDINRNEVDGVFTQDAFTSTEKTHNGDINEEDKKRLDSRLSSEDSDDFKPSRACLTPTSLIYAISVTLACFWCFPIGIFAIYRALQVRPRVEAGDFEGAVRASKSSGFWATVVLVWGTLIIGAVLVLVVLFT